MDRINILNKVGYLSDEDRKAPLERGFEWFTFKTCLDLTQPIRVIPFGPAETFTLNQYSSDVASFIAWWSRWVGQDLNGFSGFQHVTFDLVGFKLLDR